MTGAELTTLIRKKTRTDSGKYSDANLLIDINIFKNEIAGQISAARDEAFNVETNDDLLEDVREYDFDDDIMNSLVRLDLMFDSDDDRVYATPITQNHVKIPLQESIIIGNFNNTNPRYFIRSKRIYILSGTIADVTDGITWVFRKFPADLANLTGSTDLSAWATAVLPGMPREFHELWARRVAIEYKDINDIALSSREQKYEVDFQIALDNFKIPNTDTNVISSLPSASSRGDDGFEY